MLLMTIMFLTLLHCVLVKAIFVITVLFFSFLCALLMWCQIHVPSLASRTKQISAVFMRLHTVLSSRFRTLF